MYLPSPVVILATSEIGNDDSEQNHHPGKLFATGINFIDYPSDTEKHLE